MTSLLFALLAGVLTTLNPCVLPMLPLLLMGTAARGTWGPAWIAGGLVTGFTAIGVGVAAAGHQLGLDPGVIRRVAAVLLLGSGLVLVHGPTQAWLAGVLSPLATRASITADRLTTYGGPGQFGLGLLLGAIWSPCVGPTLGAAVALASQGENLLEATRVMLSFGLGMAGVFLGFAYASRRLVLARRRRLASLGGGGRRWFGWGLVAIGALVVTGGDKALEALVTRAMPDWMLALTTRF